MNLWLKAQAFIIFSGYFGQTMPGTLTVSTVNAVTTVAGANQILLMNGHSSPTPVNSVLHSPTLVHSVQSPTVIHTIQTPAVIGNNVHSIHSPPAVTSHMQSPVSVNSHVHSQVVVNNSHVHSPTVISNVHSHEVPGTSSIHSPTERRHVPSPKPVNSASNEKSPRTNPASVSPSNWVPPPPGSYSTLSG